MPSLSESESRKSATPSLSVSRASEAASDTVNCGKKPQNIWSAPALIANSEAVVCGESKLNWTLWLLFCPLAFSNAFDRVSSTPRAWLKVREGRVPPSGSGVTILPTPLGSFGSTLTTVPAGLLSPPVPKTVQVPGSPQIYVSLTLDVLRLSISKISSSDNAKGVGELSVV